MATDYSNYTTDLAKVREDYSSTAKKLKKNYDESLNNIEETFANRDREKNVLNEQRQKELIDQNQEHLVNINDKVNKSLFDKQKEFIEKLRENNEAATEDGKAAKTEFQEKLLRAKNAYARAAEQEKNSIMLQDKEKDQNFSRTLDTVRANDQQKIKNIEKDNNEAFAEYRKEMSNQKKQMNEKFLTNQNEQYKILKSEADKKAEIFNSKISEMNKNQGLELQNLNDKHESTTLKGKKEHRENLDSLNQKYAAFNNDLTEDFNDKFVKLREKSRNDLAKQLDASERSEQLISMDASKKISENKNMKEHEFEEHKKTIQDGYERRLENLRKQMLEQQGTYNRRSMEANALSHQESKNIATEAKRKAQMMEDFHNTELGNTRTDYREAMSNIQGEYNSKLTNLTNADDQKFEKEHREAKDKLLGNEHRYQLENEQITELNLNNIKRIQSDALKERTNLKVNAKKELSENVLQVKQTFQKRFDKTMEGLEQRIDEQKKLLEQLETGNDEKLIGTEEKLNKKLRDVEEKNKSEREIEKSGFQDRYAALKDTYEQKFREQKKLFDRELERTRKENNNIVSSLAKKNNEDVKNLMESHMKDMKRAAEELRHEKERNFKASNADKELLVERYENKIQEIKAAYDNDKMRLSEDRKLTNS